MRWLVLYLRSRRVPGAVAAAGTGAAVAWSLWTAFADSRDVDPRLVVLTVLLLVAALTVTLGGPDDDLDRTGALPWLPRRAAHLVAAGAVVLLLVLATMTTGARFGPAGVVVRDAAGLIGLTALGAATIGAARSWFLPLGWTLAALAFPLSGGTGAAVLSWQSQASGTIPAAGTAALLAVAGLLTYAAAGPARRSPAEVAL